MEILREREMREGLEKQMLEEQRARGKLIFLDFFLSGVLTGDSSSSSTSRSTLRFLTFSTGAVVRFSNIPEPSDISNL